MTDIKRIVVATRKSQLALAQTRAWVKGLEALDIRVEELHVTTTGDREQSTALSQIGGKGVFIKEIEEALLAGRADIAVHSMKDVPAETATGVAIGCVPRREDPRDAVVTRSGVPLADLPPNSTVGTSSLRRSVMVRTLRPDLRVVPLRGNVDTRLRRCAEGTVDAVVLAFAGLRRLGLSDRATEVLDPSQSLPAIGQGALAIEYRVSDVNLADLLARLSDPVTTAAVAGERGVMVAAEGSCQIPIAGYAVVDGDQLWIRAMLAEPDGGRPRWGERRLPWPCSPTQAFAAGCDLGRELKSR